MNNRQSNHFNMFLQVQRFLDQSSAAWSKVRVVGRYKNELDASLQQIREQHRQTDAVTTGISADKSQLKDSIATRAAVVAGALYAYAAGRDDNTLLATMDWSASRLYKAKDTDFPRQVTGITAEASARLDELADYGVLQEQLTDIESSLDDFRELIGMPRLIRSQAGSAKTNLASLIDGVNAMLKEQLDKVMMQFRLTDATFYEGYQRARVIVDN